MPLQLADLTVLHGSNVHGRVEFIPVLSGEIYMPLSWQSHGA